MFTNYSNRVSEHDCPDCGKEKLSIILKREVTLFKYWFECLECGFETHTKRGPSHSENDMYNDSKVGKIADETAKVADERANF